ncbi:hypothetical protein Nmel_003325 [Mimus melanotis]
MTGFTGIHHSHIYIRILLRKD